MIFRMYKPGFPLGRFVENMVYYEGLNLDHTIERFLPDGGIELIIDMHEWPKKLYDREDLDRFTEYKYAYISGQRRRYIHIGAAPMSSMMVVRFHIGGAFPFLDFPVSEINDSVVPMDAVWNREFFDVREQIILAEDINQKFHLLEQFLLSRAHDRMEENRLLQSAIRQLQYSPQHIATREVAGNLGISQKHLISLFNKKVGLTPKYLSRVLRFQMVIQELEKKRSIDWMNITYKCGYYDQAHFIKDFHEFSGMNPSTYIKIKGEYMNFLPVR